MESNTRDLQGSLGTRERESCEVWTVGYSGAVAGALQVEWQWIDAHRCGVLLIVVALWDAVTAGYARLGRSDDECFRAT